MYENMLHHQSIAYFYAYLVSFPYDSFSSRNSKRISELLERREMADLCKQHCFFCFWYL